jgi:hypothetical protein
MFKFNFLPRSNCFRDFIQKFSRKNTKNSAEICKGSHTKNIALIIPRKLDVTISV